MHFLVYSIVLWIELVFLGALLLGEWIAEFEGQSRGDLMASKSLTFFDKKNLNWGGLKKWQKLSSVICSFTQQGHFVMSSCPQMKPENVISSPPRVEKRVFQLLRF